MTGRLLVSMAVMTALTGPVAATPAFAQAPIQLYPRAAPAVPPPSQEPARPVPLPEPPPAVSAPPISAPAVPAPIISPPTAPRGIAVTPLPPTAPAPVPPPAQPAPRDEVLAVVEGFYAALARGDGAQANQFLVPDKRNQGAYESAAMTRFYSAMSEPLRVIGVGLIDPLVVRVQYAYTHQSGRRCDGVADVTVNRVGGRALIERIRALSGC